MENIVWLAHGGPGSGRYPKGSGKNPRGAYRTLKRISKKTYRTKPDYDYEKMKKYLSNDQKKSLNKTKSDYLKLDRKITDYRTGDYLKGTSKKDIKEHIKKWNDHQKNAEKIANEILDKYGDKKIKVALAATWNGKRWVKNVFESKSKDRLKFILSTLSHGGAGSGWFAEDGHVPGSQGGSVTTKKKKKKRKISGVTDSPLKGKSKIVDTDKKDESRKGPTAKDIENFGKKVSDVNNATRTISSNVETVYRHIRNTKSKKNRANSLTDDELRAAINRIQLEQRYNELTAPQKSNGYEKTMAALAIIGSAATIAGTGITIASGIKKLRQK